MFEDSLLVLRPGERRVYHRGHLSNDCLKSPLAARVRQEAQDAYARGRVLLFQRRSKNVPTEFEYLAIGC
ncbi:MAG TPA: hypothetical protein VFY28_02630 [Candidatus Paceibacterota bacterium]|nr:hypothetical protein [Candidatus Paceibacterota bacterium]